MQFRLSVCTARRIDATTRQRPLRHAGSRPTVGIERTIPMRYRRHFLFLVTMLVLTNAAIAQVTQFAPQDWALDRIDQRNGPLNNAYSYTTTGAGVHIYLVDSGIRLDHAEFAGRLTVDADYVVPNGLGIDCNGH